jgi:hypothetical protein
MGSIWERAPERVSQLRTISYEPVLRTNCFLSSLDGNAFELLGFVAVPSVGAGWKRKCSGIQRG